MIKTIHAKSYYLVGLQIGSNQVYIQETCSYRTNFPLASVAFRIRYCLCHPESHQRQCLSKIPSSPSHGRLSINAVEFPNEDIMTLFEEKECKKDEKWTILGFDCTNDIVEYEAYAMEVLVALEFKAKILEVYGESALGLLEKFDEINFYHIPYEDNQLVDALATLSSMFKINQRKDVPYKIMKNQHTAE
ncbi:hypothetical protein CR513_28439, partial [Mucuna pruriens]